MFRQKIQVEQRRQSARDALTQDNSLLACAFNRRGHFAIFVRNQKHNRDGIADRGCLSHQTFVRHHRHIGLDVIFFAAIDRHCVPPSRRIARHHFGRNQFEDRALAIIERVAQAIDFMFHIAQRRIGRAQLAIIDPQRSVLLFQFFQRFQSGSDRRDLFLQTGTGGEERSQYLINFRLKFTRRIRAETQEVTQNGAENQKRDDTRPTHTDVGYRIADSG